MFYYLTNQRDFHTQQHDKGKAMRETGRNRIITHYKYVQAEEWKQTKEEQSKRQS